MAKRRQPGSARLIKSTVLNSAELGKLHEITQASSVQLTDWCIRGQPDPDGVCGTIRVPRARLKRTVGQLLDLARLRLDLEILIRGQPRPDIFEINFRR